MEKSQITQARKHVYIYIYIYIYIETTVFVFCKPKLRFGLNKDQNQTARFDKPIFRFDFGLAFCRFGFLGFICPPLVEVLKMCSI